MQPATSFHSVTLVRFDRARARWQQDRRRRGQGDDLSVAAVAPMNRGHDDEAAVEQRLQRRADHRCARVGAALPAPPSV
jgi:hypothetical protein